MSNLLGLDNAEKGGERYSEVDHEQLMATVKSGANWFYWIAGLSAINSIIYISGSSWSFLAGLGFTQLADALVDVAIENGAPPALKVVAIIFNFFLVGLFALFGYYAGKRFLSAFIVGMLIYVFDALLLLLLGVFLSAGFHAFASFFIIRGLLACRTLNSQLRSAPADGNMPPPPPPLNSPAI